MKVGILTCAYNEERFIGPCIKQFDGFDVDHLVLLSTRTWSGKEEKLDKTKEIAEDLGAIVKSVSFDSEIEQRHFGLGYFKNHDWVLIVDVDEFYTKEDIEKILSFLKQTQREVVTPEKMLVYFGDEDHIAVRFDGQEHKPPVIAMKPHIRFTGPRDVAGESWGVPGVILYHLSYVRTDDELVRKISSWSHSHEILDGWVDRVWKRWTPDMQDFHPTAPNIFHKSVYRPIPEEIKKLL